MSDTLIRRLPFARAELTRSLIDKLDRKQPCCWCGADPERTRFQYAIIPDGASMRFVVWSRPVCSVDCYKAYYHDTFRTQFDALGVLPIVATATTEHAPPWGVLTIFTILFMIWLIAAMCGDLIKQTRAARRRHPKRTRSHG